MLEAKAHELTFSEIEALRSLRLLDQRYETIINGGQIHEDPRRIFNYRAHIGILLQLQDHPATEELHTPSEYLIRLSVLEDYHMRE